MLIIHTTKPVQNPMTILPAVIRDKTFLKTTGLVTVVAFTFFLGFSSFLTYLDKNSPVGAKKRSFKQNFKSSILSALFFGTAFFGFEVLSRSGIDIRYLG